MIRYFAGHPTAANLLMVALMLSGLFVLPSMKRETMPEIDKFEVQVSVPYAGAAAAEVEDSICLPLEEATDGISFIDERLCEAKDNLGLMTLKMQEAGDMDQFVADVESAVDSIDSLPAESERPVIEELGRTQGVVSIAISADLPLPQLNQLAEHYRRELLRDPAIPIVRISGFSDHQLQIEVSDYNLRQYGLSVMDLANIIDQQAIDMPAGKVSTPDREYQVRFTEERRTVAELENLVVIKGGDGAEVRLGDIAKIYDDFELAEDKITFDGHRAALLNVEKNSVDDSLRVLEAVRDFVDRENENLPEGMKLTLTQDSASIVADRLQMIMANAWQGLILVALALYLFFSGRYVFWVVMGLPVSFLGSFALITAMGVSINMISLVGLLIAIGILMDDAIVLSESIASEHREGRSPLEAVINGTKRVARGVLSSFATTVMVFGGLVFIKGDMGQVLKVLPIVLISVLLISLIEAFLILPAHLRHALEHKSRPPAWKQAFAKRFDGWRENMGRAADWAVKYRYAFVGGVFGLFLVTISLMTSGIVKFQGFPTLEGDLLQARILMPQGTSLVDMEKLVDKQLKTLDQVASEFSENERAPLVNHTSVTFGVNGDAFESGPHVATINVDLLAAEGRNTSMDELRHAWREAAGDTPGAIAILYKEPALGPAGRAIHLRLAGLELDQLKAASIRLQNWLRGYDGVVNVVDDLRPGKPQLTVKMREGSYASGLDASNVANQLRAAYQGMEIDEIQYRGETYEIQVRMDANSRGALSRFDELVIIHPATKQRVPLIAVADIEMNREYARIQRIDGERVVSVFADVFTEKANAGQVLGDTQEKFLSELTREFPGLRVDMQGEMKNSEVTGKSIGRALLIGAIGIYLLLSMQFRSYVEPLIVLVAIPLALIGVIWGHLIMGQNMSMPSMMGFVSLAGIVVNDSILLVEFVKRRVREGMDVHSAASRASRDRFRAIFLTSLTTVAGLLPLLFETSLQAQVLVPLVTSIVFGISSSTILILLVLPALYGILEDFGFTEPQEESDGEDVLVPAPMAPAPSS
ncbi:efflux RND transporter permease subunit [Microbulbifer sp. SSSA008]|uniref:efflux RND transporter permease subunit n=1 Tax=Microbulbifer sp. SSSA008 TaxID=3243380 RepID=UPI00403A34F0